MRSWTFATSKALVAAFFLIASAPALADEYSDTLKTFRNAGQSSAYFKSAYGYAVFPTIGKGGIVVGGAYGSGRVYAGGKMTGTTSMTQGSVGFQLGGQAYSQIIFFQNKKAFDEFTSGDFTFGAQASAVAITAGASAQTGRATGSSASTSQKHATTAGGYHRGMAVFTVAKGGLMYEAAIAGQKFSYKRGK
jgi:lipid-binding SYLF domain-containing protein